MTPEQIHSAIDGIARDYDHYEFGLPYSDEPKAKIVALLAVELAAARLEGATQAWGGASDFVAADDQAREEFEEARRVHLASLGAAPQGDPP